MKYLFAAAAMAVPLGIAQPAQAKPGDPIPVAEGVTFDPIIDGNLRYEMVDQAGKAQNANAVTMRVRAGGELKMHGLSILAEAEGNLAIDGDYYDTIAKHGNTQYPTVADPQNVALNRLQIGYATKDGSITFGRQRIILDDARFVGNVGWRQNEQTYDAVRGKLKVGPLSLDGTYAISQRTVFGIDSPNSHFDGRFYLVNGALDLKPVKLVGFAYLLDYRTRAAFSSQTYGALATTALPLGGKAKLHLKGSYANQSGFRNNPVDFRADYYLAEAGVGFCGFDVTGGYEVLGSDRGKAAFQTPMATLHAFNGWADLFLTTPAAGLRDTYASLGKQLGDAGPIKGVNAKLVYHKFDSDFGSVKYGTEWDASLGFKVGRYPILFKYANYDAKGFGVDTKKFWAQISFSY